MTITNRLHPITNFFLHPLQAVQNKNRITQVTLLSLWATISLLSFGVLLAFSRWYEGRLIRPVDPALDLEAGRIEDVALPVLSPLSTPAVSVSPPVTVKTVADVAYVFNDTLPQELNFQNYLGKLKAEIGFAAITPAVIDLFMEQNPGKTAKVRLEKKYRDWMEETHAKGPVIPVEVSVKNCRLLLSELRDYRVNDEALGHIQAYFNQVFALPLDGMALEILIREAASIERMLPAKMVNDIYRLIDIFKNIQSMPPRITDATFEAFQAKIVCISSAFEEFTWADNCYTQQLILKIKEAFENIAFKATQQVLDLPTLTAIKPNYDLIAKRLVLDPMIIKNDTKNDRATALALQAAEDEEAARALSRAS